MSADREFLIAVRLLLDAIANEDSERAVCEGVSGAALFLAIGAKDAATELRKGYMRAVQRRLATQPPADSQHKG